MRLIDADKVIPVFKDWINDVKREYPDAYACAYIFTMKKIVEMLEEAEVADVQPVVHGKWDRLGDRFTTYICSACENMASFRFDYCPNCGARMEAEE